MAFSFLPHVDDLSNGLKLSLVTYIGALLAIVQTSTVQSTLDALQQNTSGLAVHLLVTAVEDVNDIISLLDAGAFRVIINLEQLKALQTTKELAFERLVLDTTGLDKDAISKASTECNLGAFKATLDDTAAALTYSKDHGSEAAPAIIELKSPSRDHLVKIAATGAVPIVPISSPDFDTQTDEGSLAAAKIVLAAATTDRPDGLFTTLVTDERGIALGLVYSSELSVAKSLQTGRGVYQSRKRGLWFKGESSGDTQELVRLGLDCDKDCLGFVVRQKGKGFCHLGTATCFGNYTGLSRLQKTLQDRKANAPPGSYTARLFNDQDLLKAKIQEEAGELCEATSKEHIAFEAADLLYFALTKCVAAGVSLEDVERNLDNKALKVKRRPGNAKVPLPNREAPKVESQPAVAESAQTQTPVSDRIIMKRYDTAIEDAAVVEEALRRPSQRSTEMIMGIVQPIIKAIQERGDSALLEYTHKFDRATSLTSPVLKAPFAPGLMQLSEETKNAIDLSFANIQKFHAAQKEQKPLVVETMPGVVCQRFSRPIERVGLYVPGGTAVLPSTAMMLGIPAMVAGCRTIVLASPPRPDGSITPEIVYIAHKVGAESIVLAGGAQAVAAMAYGTESVSKVDKILGPGNQFVTAGKMIVSNDTSAAVAIDMPAGPSEILVVADKTARPEFVASDLLSQAEHGPDSQVVLIAVDLTEEQLIAIEDEVDKQANALPRKDIVRQAIEHSVTLIVKNVEEALYYSNKYAPEHIILQIKDAEQAVPLVQNAGSVFIGHWTPESVGDYSAGVNHSLRKS